MFESVDGFDWDEGNWPKCGKHGVSREEVEELFRSGPFVGADPCKNEERMRAIGTNAAGRPIFVVFAFRITSGLRLIRPISARYMHQKEAEQYGKGL